MGKQNIPQIDQSLVRGLFGYDEKGLYKLKSTTNSPAGKRAHKIHKQGYKGFKINGKVIGEHRLVWVYHFGFMPSLIDHINGDRSDNRVENLRVATNSQNICNSRLAKNNTSGAKGVIWAKDRNKWRARIVSGVVKKWLGSFNSYEEACKTVNNARKELHKDFANTGV
jgi:hypothetical protein